MPVVLGSPEMVLPLADDSLLTMNQNGVFRWNIHSKRLVTSYRPHAALTEASFSFDGRRIATASRSVKIWDAKTGKAIGKIETPHAGPVHTIQFAPKAIGQTDHLFATGGDDGVARLWTWNDQTSECEPLREFAVDGISGAIRRLRFSPDGQRLLVVGDGGFARLWQWNAQVEPMVFDSVDAGDFTCGAISADGSVIAIGSSDRRVRLWNVPPAGVDPAEPTILSGHADVVNDVKLIGKSGNLLHVLTASADDTARIWDPRLGAAGRRDCCGARDLVAAPSFRRRHSHRRHRQWRPGHDRRP